MHRLAGRARPVAVRILGSLVVILGVVTLTFVLARIVSPDPTNLYVSPQANLATREAIRHTMGLDKSIPAQYGQFLIDLLHGKLGTSFSTGQPVTSDLTSRLPATFELATYAVVLGTLLGFAIGILSAVFEGSVVDKAFRFLTVTGLAMPQFWIGLMLLWIFFVVLGISPGPVGRLPIGMNPPPQITSFVVIDSLLSGHFDVAKSAAAQLALPVITLAIAVFAPIARTVRTAMIEALATDYIRTAIAMNIPRRTIWFKYAFKNVLLPVLTMLAGVIGFAFSGAVLVEGIFAWPGVGQYALNAIEQSDFPAIQGFVLYAAILYVLIYLVLDLTYTSIDPRVRT
jgi:ABC-type dipeptide/oligopeptide/nickel transport system permease component